jgi:hypothetical protein
MTFLVEITSNLNRVQFIKWKRWSWEIMISSVVEFALTILFGAFTVYSVFIGKKIKELAWFRTTLEVVKSGCRVLPDLNVLYKGMPLENMTISKYAIWNSGNEVLNWTDIAEACPLQIVCNDNVKILDIRIISQSDETNKFKIKVKNEHCIGILFDYVEPKGGIVIQIMHTGEDNDINLECKIKGGKTLKNVTYSNTSKIYKNLSVKVVWLISLLMSAISLTIITLGKLDIIPIIQIDYMLWNSDMFIFYISRIILTIIMGILFVIFIFIICDHFDYKSVPDNMKGKIDIDDVFGRKG